MSDNFTTRTASLRATLAQIRKLDTKELLLDGQDANNIFAKLDEDNTFTANNTFSASLQVLPLGTTTISGQDAYGLSIAPPSEDGTSGGLQLWGVQFSIGDEWSETALKINHPQLALFGTSAIPTTLSFDNANVVEFKTMPDDGSTTGVTYDFQSWQWTDDTHTDKTNTAPVQILKNNAISLEDKSVLNMGESDERYAQLHADNTFSGLNTFEQNIDAQNGVNVTGGNVLIKDGIMTFEDLVDGTVIDSSGITGYRYVQGIPTTFANGMVYDIGEISDTTDLSNITFAVTGEIIQTCELWFTTPATAPTTHQWPNNTYWIDSATGAAPTLLASKNYRLVFRNEPNKLIASIAYLY